MKVRVSAYFNVYSSGSSFSSQYSFWNITDSYSEIWSAVTCNAGQNYDGSFEGIVTLNPLKQYSIDFGNGTTFVNQQIRSFSLVIEEIVDTSSDQFTFSDVSNRSLKVVNTLGQTSIELNNQWKISTDISGNLIFYKNNVQKGIIYG